MAKKTVNFQPKISSHQINKDLDHWVEKGNKNESIRILNEEQKRFTVVLPINLYKKIKVKCVEEDKSIKEIIKEILEKQLSAY